MRSGGSSFCGFGGKLDCEAVWSGAFASTVHRLTGVPIAGWGLAWSAAAFLLPLAASYAARINLFAAVTSAAAAGLWFLVAERWTDFLPIVLPTEERVEAMLAGTSRGRGSSS